MQTNIASNVASPAVVITPGELLYHWQGHRRLSRRTIEAFPEEEFLNFSVGGMRPFAALAMEMIVLAANGMPGAINGEWNAPAHLADRIKKGTVLSKAETLKVWDEVTALIDELWAQIPAERFHDTVLAYGMYEGPLYSIILYWIDNEIHHRGQGYVYLRALGIEPPYFWEREQAAEKASV